MAITPGRERDLWGETPLVARIPLNVSGLGAFYTRLDRRRRHAETHKIHGASSANVADVVVRFAQRVVRCPRSRRTDWSRKWLRSCTLGLDRIDCSRATADRSEILRLLHRRSEGAGSAV